MYEQRKNERTAFLGKPPFSKKIAAKYRRATSFYDTTVLVLYNQ
jgi:hypothetical protein